jgi:uncharacterized protein (TIGR03435 family)
VDKTGLNGFYDFEVNYSREDNLVASSGGDAAGAQRPAETPGGGGPSLFKALEAKLGLKLESGKGPVPVIVIDHVEKPSGN